MYTETMRFYKTKLFILFMIIAAGATFYYFGDPQKVIETVMPYVEKTPLDGIIKEIDVDKVEKVTADISAAVQTAEEDISTLNERGQEVGEHTANILGSSIEATEDATPLHEKAFEYGKYIYTQKHTYKTSQ